MKPVDAEIPELKFSYYKNGIFKSAYGHAGGHFSEGDLKIFKVKVNKYGGACKLRYIDGNDDITKDCTGLSEVTLDMGTHYKNQPEVIGISVSQEKLGIQQGYFYSLMRKERESLPVDFKCPYSDSTGDLAVCTRPASYAFKVKAIITNNLPGELLQTFVCNDGSKYETVLPISGADEKNLEFTVRNPTFCTVGLGLRQGKRPDGTHTIIQAKSIFVRFYNPLYIPLGSPNLIMENGVKKVCSGDSYAAYTLFNRDGGYLEPQTCFSVSNFFEFFAWDSIGRFSFKSYSDSFTFAKQQDGWDFYTKAEPWIRKNMPRCKSDECIKKEYAKLIRNPKMISAIENWDSSILYK
jgi:hypothetical protein